MTSPPNHWREGEKERGKFRGREGGREREVEESKFKCLVCTTKHKSSNLASILLSKSKSMGPHTILHVCK